MAAEKRPRYTTASEEVIIALLREAHPSKSFAFFAQVGNATGFECSGWADAIAMDLWPSRGLHLHGFEVKSHRNDWLRELKNPAKADGFFHRCHTWTVVAPVGVVEVSELPHGWGLMVVKGTRLKTVRKSEVSAPAAPTWSFLAAILRRAGGPEKDGAIEEIVRQRAAERVAEIREQVRVVEERSLLNRVEEIRRLREEYDAKLRVFREVSGVDPLSGSPPAAIGEAVKMVLDGREKSVKEYLGRARDSAQAILRITEGCEA